MITTQLLSFYKEAEKLKTVMRHSWTSNPERQESVAEHTWMMGLIAISLFPYLTVTVNPTKVLTMILLHDIAEIVTGDIPAFEISERKNNKYQSERNALDKIFKDVSSKQKEEWINIWEELETKESSEAKLVQAIDKLEVHLQHDFSDIKTWDDNDFSVHAFYKNELYDFDEFLRQLRDKAELISVKKIGDSGNIERINPKHQQQYRDFYGKIKEEDL